MIRKANHRRSRRTSTDATMYERERELSQLWA